MTKWDKGYAPVRRLSFSYRLVALAILLGIFYSLDWMPMRNVQRNVVAWSLGLTGHHTEPCCHDGSPALRINDRLYFYTPQCTYIDLLTFVIPFLWRQGASHRNNLIRIVFAALVIIGGNLVRTWASVHFNVRGADWFWTHHLPHYVIWSFTVTVAGIVAARRDARYAWASLRASELEVQSVAR